MLLGTDPQQLLQVICAMSECIQLSHQAANVCLGACRLFYSCHGNRYTLAVACIILHMVRDWCRAGCDIVK